MLCTIFLVEEMSVRKTVTAWSPKRSRNAIVTGEQEFMNGSSKVSGFLLRIAFYRRFYAGTNSRFPRITPDCPTGARGGKLIRKRTAKWPFYRTATSLDYRLKTLSLQVATHQAQAGKSAPEQHRSRSAIRRSCGRAKLPD